VPKLFTVTTCASALVLGALLPTAVAAQTPPVTQPPAPSGQTPPRPELDVNGRPIATEGTSRFRSRGGGRNRAPRAPDPEEMRAAAQEQATAAGLACQVTQANSLGRNGEGQNAYEAACSEGPGYILISSEPPQATSCLEVYSTVRQAREANPAGAVGIECKIPQNTAVLPLMTAYATQAGVKCQVDDAIAVGKDANRALIFEVGCAGQDGYRISQSGGSWVSLPCLEIVSTPNGTCRFTTPQEQAATVKTWLAGSEAAACDVQQARYMGRNANGAFYEAKCTAGDGYIARLDNAKAVQQVYPCAQAAQIGGGCTLTTAAAAPAATAPTPVPATE